VAVSGSINVHQLGSIRHRQEAEKERVDKAEDGSIRADSQGQHKDGNTSEPRRFTQPAESVLDVLRQSLNQMNAAGLAALFLDLVRAAKHKTGLAASFRERQARLDKFIDLPVDMKMQLIVEFSLHGLAAKQSTEANQEVSHHRPLLGSSSMVCLLRGLQHLGNGRGERLPVALFRFQMFPAASREFVKLGAAIVLRCTPACLDPAASFQAMESGVQRALLDLQNFAGDLMNALRDGPAVVRPRYQASENQQIQRALWKIDALA
jgi:hypothetical protein